MKKVLALIIALSMATTLSACSQQQRNPAGISLEEFQRIGTGMYWSKVDQIIGGSGTQISETKNETDDYIESVYVTRYDGELTGYADIEVTIRSYKNIINSKYDIAEVTGKTQYNLS